MAVNETSSAQGNVADGVFGLGPASVSGEAPSYIQVLHRNGVIGERVATLWINYNGLQSSLTLGGVPADSIRGQWFSHTLVNRQDDFWSESLWMVNLSDLKYGDESISASKIKFAVIDSYLPYIYLGKSDYELFVNKL